MNSPSNKIGRAFTHDLSIHEKRVLRVSFLSFLHLARASE